MGLMDIWSRAAASRPHVLIAEASGVFRQRVALEGAVDAAGWCVAETVADADIFAVVGEPGPELMAVIDRTWEQMSEPRARIAVHEEADIAAALVGARNALWATKEQRAQAARRPDSRGSVPDGDGDHEHAGHEHGGMNPEGIPLAEGAEDRDGLEMDELHLPLGPVLAHWPAGVVLRLTLHGDVVAGAEVQHLDDAYGVLARDEGPDRAARLLDALESVLTLAGLPAESARARRLRDRCLDGTPVAADELEELGILLRRHRALRWMLTGLALARDDGGREGLHERLVSLVDRAREAVDRGPSSAHRVGPALEALPELMLGQELAAVRLWMAALSADLTHDVRVGAPHG